MAGPPSFERSSASADAASQQQPERRTPAQQSTASNEPGLLLRSGSNPLVTGAVGGLIGGVLGVCLTFAVAGGVHADTRQVVLAGVVPACIGALIAGWADLSARMFERARVPMLKGAVVGAAAGLVGFGLADLVWTGLRSANRDLAMVLGWAIVAALIGLGLGLMRSTEKALAGFLGGLVGGMVGGFAMLLMGVNQRASFGPMLVAVVCATTIVGLAIGGAERIVRSVWIDVLDGPLAGREYPIDAQQVVIGSAPSAEVSFGLDGSVQAAHAQLAINETGIVITPLDGEVFLDGSLVQSPAVLQDEPRLMVGATHFVVRTKR